MSGTIGSLNRSNRTSPPGRNQGGMRLVVAALGIMAFGIPLGLLVLYYLDDDFLKEAPAENSTTVTPAPP